jgi:Spy/CpxP family protein refolding chaperone
MRKTKKTTFISAGIFAVLIASVGSVFAFGGHHHGHDPAKRASHMVEKVAKKLSLNEDQKEKLSILKEAALALHQEMHQNRQLLGKDILSLVSGDTLDEALILDHVNTKTTMVRDQAPVVVAKLADFYNSLDADQQEKVRAKLQKKMHHFLDDDD